MANNFTVAWRLIILTLCTLYFCTAREILQPDGNFVLYDPLVLCTEEYKPAYCGFPNVSLSNMKNLEDFDNCGPGSVSLDVRNVVIGATGKAITYRKNFKGFKKIEIIPRILRDVSRLNTATTVLGSEITSPIGISPTVAHALLHTDGELATARAANKAGVLYIVNSWSSHSMEDIAAAVPKNSVIWLQIYILSSRNIVRQLVRRAEAAGYKAIVVTVDDQVSGPSNCNAKQIFHRLTYPNFPDNSVNVDVDASLTFADLRWLKSITQLPIVAKGILTGSDARKVAMNGASAVLVSNMGGRLLDGAMATIDALPEVVEALKSFPDVEVYIDSGVRSGSDVFKALALGARAAFVGRPVLWGLAVAGEKGVEKVLEILKSEFNKTMALAGHSELESIFSPIEVEKYYK